jgi:hypothetical protein
MFRHTWDHAVRCAKADEAEGLGPARVLILSARYGLVRPEDLLEPYDLRMGQPGSVMVQTLAQQARSLGIDWGANVYALLPRPYLRRLDEALRTMDVYVQDVYETATGIGEQRRINVHIGLTRPAPTVSTGPGPTVWLGADAHALWWGHPILVSYGRLRTAKTLQLATAWGEKVYWRDVPCWRATCAGRWLYRFAPDTVVAKSSGSYLESALLAGRTLHHEGEGAPQSSALSTSTTTIGGTGVPGGGRRWGTRRGSEAGLPPA